MTLEIVWVEHELGEIGQCDYYGLDTCEGYAIWCRQIWIDDNPALSSFLYLCSSCAKTSKDHDDTALTEGKKCRSRSSRCSQSRQNSERRRG